MAPGPERNGDELIPSVRGSLVAHRPIDDREAASRRRIVAELSRLAAPFDRHADPTHVTGSAIVVGTRGVVLLVHRVLDAWMQPGGHVEPGEAPWDAALRETREETGLAVRHPEGGPVLVHVDVHAAGQGHTHLDLRYLLFAPDDDPKPPPDESQQVRWFTWDDARGVADESLCSALDAAYTIAQRLPEHLRIVT